MNQLLDQTSKLARGAAGLSLETAKRAAGLVDRLRPGGGARNDDAMLRTKVESALFRDPKVPKGIDVTVVGGVVELRGRVSRPKEISDIEAVVRSIPEVRGVRSMLQLPKSPPRRQAGGRTAADAAAKPRTGGQRVAGGARPARRSAAAPAEDTPLEKAAKGEGRTPAPMGSQESGGESASEPSTGGGSPASATNAPTGTPEAP